MKNALLRGTLLLTIAGLFSRILGFFYRIFLANTIGAEGMGIYQLIFPIYSICFSLCASGIETAISKLTAEKYALGKQNEASQILKLGLFITGSLSIGCSLILFCYADYISIAFLKEERCAALLKLLALAIPFGTTHACAYGYYYGIHKAGIPSIAQLIEQFFRIGSVFLLYQIYKTNQIALTPSIAVLGLILGEFFAFIFTVTCLTFQSTKKNTVSLAHKKTLFLEIMHLSAPLTISRICINLLASLESTLIPHSLRSYGMTSESALSVYGILNGMAIPFILFPNTLTSSISLMLLPEVSKSQAAGQLTHLKNTIRKSFSFCILLGCCSLLFFLFFGKMIGTMFFSNKLAGTFITILAWICPFLYLNTTLSSVLNGLGKTNVTFFNGIAGLFLRIGFICFLVPRIGIHGYLYGLLASQLFTTLSGCFFLRSAFH